MGTLRSTFITLLTLSAWGLAPSSFAQNNNNGPNGYTYDPSKIPKAVKDCQQQFKDDPIGLQVCYNGVTGGKSGGSSDNPTDCPSAEGKLDDTLTKVGKKCQAIGYPNSAKECAEKNQKCSMKSSKSKSDDDDSDDDSEQCAQKGKDKLKLQDDADKVTGDLNKLKSDLGALNDKIADANQTATDKVNELQDKIKSAGVDYTKAQAEMQKQISQRLNDQQRQQAQAIQGMQDSIDQLRIQAKDIPNQKAQARIKTFTEPVTNLRITCHQQAIKRVADISDQRLAKIAKSQYTVGGLASIVRTMGMTDMQRDQALAQNLELQCLNDGEYKMRVQLAYDEYRSTLAEIDHQLEANQAQQSSTIKKMQTLQAQSQIDKNQIYSEANTDMQAARMTNYQQMTSLNDQLATAKQSAQTKINSLNQQVAMKNDEIKQKTDFMNKKQKIAQMAEVASHDVDYGSKELGDFEDALSAAEAAAQKVYRYCGCPGGAGSCDQAADFLTAMGDTLPTKHASNTPPAPAAPSPAPSPAIAPASYEGPSGSGTPRDDDGADRGIAEKSDAGD